MSEFVVPSSEVFDTWADVARPVAVIRLRCSKGHDIAEYWLTGAGDYEPWLGRVRPGQRGPFHQDALNVPVVAEMRPDLDFPDVEMMWRSWFVCPRPTCNDKFKMTSGVEKLESLLDTLASGGGPHLIPALSTQIDVEEIAHPSGASAIAFRIDDFQRSVASRK